MLTVCNTTPINYLVLLGLKNLLERQFGEIIIPTAVLDELSDSRAPSSVRKWLQSRPAWLRVETVTIPDHQDFRGIHRGEIAAISLAEALGADVVIIDDAQARIIASRRNLQLAGTLGILRDAAKEGLISDLRETLTQLRALGFHITTPLLNQLSEEAR